MEKRFVLVEKAAQMPSSCKWGGYRKLAILELEQDVPEGFQPAMMSTRAVGVKRVVRVWDRLNSGTSERCALARARREAEQLLAELSSSGEV